MEAEIHVLSIFAQVFEQRSFHVPVTVLGKEIQTRCLADWGVGVIAATETIKWKLFGGGLRTEGSMVHHYHNIKKMARAATDVVNYSPR